MFSRAGLMGIKRSGMSGLSRAGLIFEKLPDILELRSGFIVPIIY